MVGKSWKQVDYPPTEQEIQDVKDGHVDILRYYEGKFQRLNNDEKWEEVAAIPEEWNEYPNKKRNNGV